MQSVKQIARDAELLHGIIDSTKSLGARTDELVAHAYQKGLHLAEFMQGVKRAYVMTVLRAHGGNQCRAARDLGQHRNTLARTISELHIDLRQFHRNGKKPSRWLPENTEKTA